MSNNPRIDQECVEIGVNSTALAKAIKDTIFEALEHLYYVSWRTETFRKAFVESVEDYMTAWEEDGKVSRFNVICDARNNTFAQGDEIHLDIEYLQRNCLNTTKLLFTFKPVSKEVVIAALADSLRHVP